MDEAVREADVADVVGVCGADFKFVGGVYRLDELVPHPERFVKGGEVFFGGEGEGVGNAGGAEDRADGCDDGAVELRAEGAREEEHAHGGGEGGKGEGGGVDANVGDKSVIEALFVKLLDLTNRPEGAGPDGVEVEGGGGQVLDSGGVRVFDDTIKSDI
jgi:hypothetical protein